MTEDAKNPSSSSRIPTLLQGGPQTFEVLFSAEEEGPFSDGSRSLTAVVDWNVGLGKFVATRVKSALRFQVDPDDYRRPGAPVAVVLPGWRRQWANVLPWGKALHALGWDVHFVPALDMEQGSIRDLGETLTEYLAEQDLRDALIVAHSKGGLVAKQAMVGSEGERVARLIAVGTPFEGAPLASLLPEEVGAANLTPDSMELRLLSENTSVNKRIYAVEAAVDQNVPRLKNLPGGHIITTTVHGHSALMDAPEALAWIVALAGSSPTAPALDV